MNNEQLELLKSAKVQCERVFDFERYFWFNYDFNLNILK